VPYANSAWNPYTGWAFKELEKVQMRATKLGLVITVKNLRYMGRLIRLNLPTLKYRGNSMRQCHD